MIYFWLGILGLFLTAAMMFSLWLGYLLTGLPTLVAIPVSVGFFSLSLIFLSIRKL